MKRRGFLGAMLGIPAIPVAAKAISELEKFDAKPMMTATEITRREREWADSFDSTSWPGVRMTAFTAAYMPGATSWAKFTDAD